MVSTTRFVVTSQEVSWIGSLAFISITTDVPCHLFCRYTKNPMRVHNAAKIIRGAAKLAEPDYCFTAASMIEQDEAGDTTEHSFSFGDFGYGEKRWWIFVGTINGVDSPSQSPIFYFKYQETPVYSLGIFGSDISLSGSVYLEAAGEVVISYLDPPDVGLEVGLYEEGGPVWL